jgi:uncharacterized protein YndB with AHSA1/START domain
VASLADTVVVDAPASRVWGWLLDLADHYRAWHPDHLRAEWVEGEPNHIGSVLLAAERLHGRPHAVRARITELRPNERLAYRFLWPASLLARGGAFLLVPEDGRTRFTAAIEFRWFAALLSRRRAALRRHLREEGESLKRQVEADGWQP